MFHFSDVMWHSVSIDLNTVLAFVFLRQSSKIHHLLYPVLPLKPSRLEGYAKALEICLHLLIKALVIFPEESTTDTRPTSCYPIVTFQSHNWSVLYTCIRLHHATKLCWSFSIFLWHVRQSNCLTAHAPVSSDYWIKDIWLTRGLLWMLCLQQAIGMFSWMNCSTVHCIGSNSRGNLLPRRLCGCVRLQSLVWQCFVACE